MSNSLEIIGIVGTTLEIIGTPSTTLEINASVDSPLGIEATISPALEITSVVSPSLEIVANVIATGPMGPKPIKGVDYFTQEDINAIIEQIEHVGVDQNYVHNQIAAASTWNVNHNLYKFPSVMIVDSAGTVIQGEIQHIDTNNLIITFTSEFSGKAFIN